MEGMTLRTRFTELLGVAHPIALAPMGGAAGGALAAAVSNGGALGLVGGGREDPEWLKRELGIVVAATDKPWGIGFQSWSATTDVIETALEYRPHAVMLSFGDPTALTEPAEAGGHTGGRATLPFVPIVVDLAGPTPVLAAGGIADGRGVAAALALGAAGALIGTRFQVTTEALVAAEVTKAIIEGRGEDTERSRILDIARGAPWPARYPARTLRNAFLDRWRGRETELESDEEAKASFRDAAHRGDLDVLPVWASESIDLITEALPAAELVSLLVSEAEQALMRAGRAVTPTGHINGRGDAVHPA
jgi:nitronate monooxygenase